MNAPPAQTPKRSHHIWLFRILAIAFPLLLLLLVEFGLRAAGTGYPTEFLVPHPTKPGYLVDNYKFAWRFFPKALARAPRPIVVQEAKPANTFRICVFGGSAAMGDPEPAYGMPRVIETLLQNRFPEKDFEVINCAVTAINSHVVRDIARDCRRLNADAWVVYLGNNEVHGPFGAGTVFGRSDRSLWMNRLGLGFKKSKLGQLLTGGKVSSEGAPKNWGGMQMFLDQKVARDDPRLKKVYADFEANLGAIVRAAGSSTKIVMGTVASNTKDFPPFVSKPITSDSYQAACRLQAEGKYTEAIAAFDNVGKNAESESAELWYRKGQCARASEPPLLLQSIRDFDTARDLDMLRFRADSQINKIIKAVAQANSLPWINSESKLIGEGDVPGNEHFYEHVHFKFAGNYVIGRAFARKLAVALGLSPHEDASQDGWVSQSECAAELGLTPFHERLTLLDVRGRLNSPPFGEQLGHAERDAAIAQEMQQLASQMTPEMGQKTIEHYNQLIEKRPDDWLLRQQFAMLLDSIGQQAAAAEQYAAIAKQLPHNAEAQFRIGAQYNRMKQREKAEVALQKAIELRPDFARAYNSLGICLSHQDRANESYEQFAKAVAMQPTFAEAYVNWGMVLAAKDQQDAAVAKYLQAIDVAPNNLQARAELGKHFVSANKYQDAMPHYEAIARVLPNDVASQLNLGLLYLKVGDHRQQAREQFERVLKLSPENPQATEGLRRLP